LSENPIPDDMGIAEMVSYQDFSVDYEFETNPISGKQMAEELLKQHSEPEFFMLTEAGEDAEE